MGNAWVISRLPCRHAQLSYIMVQYHPTQFLGQAQRIYGSYGIDVEKLLPLFDDVIEL